MIKFDKLKIVSQIDYVEILDYSKFECKLRDGYISEYRITITNPYLLYVEIDYLEKELVIEFTGKILGDDYPQLINQNNIHVCLDHINQLGFCNLDIDKILTDAEVVKADVALDIHYPNCNELSSAIRASVCNFKKYLTRNISDNLIIEKNVTTKSYKQRLTIYDKEAELQRASNRKFMDTLADRKKLQDYFKDKVRFELNLNSKEQLRRALNIPDTSLNSVLDSDANPIWSMLDKALVEVGDATTGHSLSELKNLLLLEYCGGDLVKVEALLRQHLSPKTHISKVMNPFRILAERVDDNPKSIKTILRNLLLEITILLGIFI